MVNYSTWTTKDLKISSLLLDNVNPRFPDTKSNKSQNDLINFMVKHYKIYDLAQSIAKDGFFQDKKLICIPDSNHYIIIEGNRRLSALKGLLFPDLLEEPYKSKFKKLSDLIDKGYIQTIQVVIAPSRKDTMPIIFKEHTEKTSEPWSTIMQAEFYVRLI